MGLEEKMSGTIIYDGFCTLCINSIKKIQHYDVHNQLSYLPSQDSSVLKTFPQLVGTDFNKGVVFVDKKGASSFGSKAISDIYKVVRPKHILAWGRDTPLLGPLIDSAYSVIAKNRYRLNKKSCEGVCHL